LNPNTKLIQNILAPLEQVSSVGLPGAQLDSSKWREDGKEEQEEKEEMAAVTLMQPEAQDANDQYRDVLLDMMVEEREGEVAAALSRLARRVNNFYMEGLGAQAYLPLLCGHAQVGMISPQVLAQLLHYPAVFSISKEKVILNEKLTTEAERSAALEEVLLDLKRRDVFPPLRGWRKECYEVRESLSQPLLFKMERSAAPLFGIRQYGVHINGFVRHSSRGLCLWLQRRSASKQTWPNMMDNFVGGALADGVGVLETAVKEAAEEANVPESLATEMRPAGSVSFLHLSKRGIHNNTLFIYDLELPESFEPTNNDGEVSG